MQQPIPIRVLPLRVLPLREARRRRHRRHLINASAGTVAIATGVAAAWLVPPSAGGGIWVVCLAAATYIFVRLFGRSR